MKTITKLRNSESGFTIVEVLASIGLSVIVVLGAVLALIAFFNKFDEYQARTYVYQDAFNALNQIKFGVKIGSEFDPYFYGVSSSTSIVITRGSTNSSGSGVMVFPSIEVGGSNDFSEYYFHQGQIKATYQYQSVAPPAPIIIFPRKYEDRITVTDFTVTKVNTSELPQCVEIELKAVLMVKDKEIPIHYTTKMATIIVNEDEPEE
ncbi:MAG: hypothetical protein JXR56_02735 [Candidatus Cloacimonetes bacterium]|nr:hypothetical protein [Candidatus Cloacimonadota bacterium]